MLMRLLSVNAQEIQHDRALRIFGAGLALTNALAMVFWLTAEPIAQILAPGETPVCWPIFQSCGTFRVLGPGAITSVVGLLLVVSLANAVCFAQERWVRIGYVSLALVTLLKSLLVIQDYRLIHNQHYMALWMIAAFLLVPQKRAVLPALLVSFYVWAGLLKLNTPWLSGEALYGRRPLGVPVSLIPASCVYVVVLELVFSWGLLSSRTLVWGVAFAQLFLFHVVSWGVVGFFYPLLMFLLIAIVPLARLIPAPREQPVSARSQSRIAVASVVCAFAVCQLVPRMLSDTPAFTGEGRLFALHMFDAPMECRSERLVSTGDGSKQAVGSLAVHTYPRLACDPWVHHQLASAFCRLDEASYPAGEFDFRLTTWKRGELDRNVVVEIRAFCANRPTYSAFRHNPWIRDPSTVNRETAFR